MARRRVSPPIVRWLSGLLASVTMVAALSALLTFLNPHVPPLYLRVLYVLVVLPVAIVWGTGLAAFTAVLSAAVYDYFFLPPPHSFRVTDWRAAVSLGVFLVTAVVVGQLAAQLRRSALKLARLSEEQTALRRVATLVAHGASPPDVFSAVAEELAKELGASITNVLRYEDDGTATVVGGWSGPGMHIPAGTRLKVAGQDVAGAVLQTGVAARTERFEGPPGSVARAFQDAGVTAGAGSPIVVEGRLWGIAIAASPDADALPAATEHRIADFTELVATAIANAEAQAELTASRARIAATADETRRRIERDLHDGAQQRLVSLVLQPRAAQAAVPPEFGAELDRLIAGLTSVHDELREYARGIHPAILTEGGLA
ncbi:MAG TPA: DUF4118 domain-containing protein, partial [Streptosporangiaceae bacterium]|nr:DUF4118 domain-containing protein [Streptosporangiaceae bacterium]